MIKGKFFDNPRFREYATLLRELHALIRRGTDESAEGEALRDRMDIPMEYLDQDEIDVANRLSADLYTLFAESKESPLPMVPRAREAINAAFAERSKRQFANALDLFRTAAPHFEVWQINYARGSTLLDAGLPGLAADFFLDVSRRRPDYPNFRFMWLSALAYAAPDAARKESQVILKNYAEEDPKLIYRAADILFAETRNLPDADANEVIKGLIPVFEDCIFRFQLNGHETEEKSTVAAAMTLLGFCHEHLGHVDVAMNYFDRGVKLYPHNDALYVARGMQQYGEDTASAVGDFRKATELDSKLVWPYFFLAHFYLGRGDIEECMKMASAALQRATIASMKADCLEWIAICQASLGYPEQSIACTFDEALKWAPENQRIVHNRQLFLQYTANEFSGYDLVPVDELRTVGRRHFSMLVA